MGCWGVDFAIAYLVWPAEADYQDDRQSHCEYVHPPKPGPLLCGCKELQHDTRLIRKQKQVLGREYGATHKEEECISKYWDSFLALGFRTTFRFSRGPIARFLLGTISMTGCSVKYNTVHGLVWLSNPVCILQLLPYFWNEFWHLFSSTVFQIGTKIYMLNITVTTSIMGD